MHRKGARAHAHQENAEEADLVKVIGDGFLYYLQVVSPQELPHDAFVLHPVLERNTVRKHNPQ